MAENTISRKATLTLIETARKRGYEVGYGESGWTQGPCYHRLGCVRAVKGGKLVHETRWDVGSRKAVPRAFRTHSRQHSAWLEVIGKVAAHANDDYMLKLLKLR